MWGMIVRRKVPLIYAKLRRDDDLAAILTMAIATRTPPGRAWAYLRNVSLFTIPTPSGYQDASHLIKTRIRFAKEIIQYHNLLLCSL